MCASSSLWWLAGGSDGGMALATEEGASGMTGEGEGTRVVARAEEVRCSEDR
jgi:hypothetical protein